MMTPLIFASAMALFRATLSSDDPLFAPDASAGAPHPVNGIWAALGSTCEAPTSLDLATWPKCATPVGFLDGEIAALQKPGTDSKAPPDQFYSIARTHFWVIKGAPAIVEVDVPVMFNHSTVYIAVQPDSLDPSLGFVAATGWPIVCPPTPLDGVAQDGARCTASTRAGVVAASMVPPDPAKTYRLVRVTEAPATVQPPVETPTPAAPDAPSTPPTAAPGLVTEAPLTAPPPTTPTGPLPTQAPAPVVSTPQAL